MRISIVVAPAMALLVPVAVAQKPSAPTPPVSSAPTRPETPTPANAAPSQPTEGRVMFIRGRVATEDSTHIPNDVLVERVCNQGVRQQVYASTLGDFTMQLGSKADSFLDATGDRASQGSDNGEDSVMGIPRRELMNCELRTSASGFHSNVISLVGLDTFDSNMDVGVILMQRAKKIEGTTLSAMPYKAPVSARRAYEKGIQSEKNGKLANAQRYFESAVEIYPRYLSAWFQLGMILQKENQTDAARSAFMKATKIDTKFIPPYLSLAAMAYDERNWTELLKLTDHILELDPFNHTNVTAYVVDLDPLNSTEAYYFNAMANYMLNRSEEAEKSARKAEHMNLRTRFPQVHLLLADIFVQRKNYAGAISEMQTYLDLAPNAGDADQVREQLAKLEKLDEKLDQN
jgi:tetratricopeptide (TPR) repeat protein